MINSTFIAPNVFAERDAKLRELGLTDEPTPLNTAPALLQRAATIMVERGKQYDKPDGERSMGKAVDAFNSVKGKTVLNESDGWLLMALLKMVRDQQRAEPHQDSCEDGIAYMALYGESRLKDTA